MLRRAARTLAIGVVCGLFAVSVWAGVVAQQQTQSVDAGGGGAAQNGSSQFAILVTTIAGVASILVTQFFQFYRENRNRKWDLADRSSARQEMRQHVETQRLETIQTAIELARVSNINRQQLSEAIDKNTQITTDAAGKADAAYTAASDFTAKLEALHAELTNLQPRREEADAPARRR